MKKLLKAPFFAGLFIFVGMALYFVVCYLFKMKIGYFDIEFTGITEALTYLFYGFSLGMLVYFAKDHIYSERRNQYFAIIFLWIVAVLREMGIQHWLTTHDTVITKSRFFLNPANPLYEKVNAAILMLIILAVVVWLTVKNFKNIIKGIIKLEGLYWTIVTSGVWVFITQIADRLPANYHKATGLYLSDPIHFIVKILEEGGESLLPLLLVVGLLQYHYINSQKDN
ncbi:MAG: hypothetical protein MJ237_05035 [bacterium]|nr:hypothetical protein [bacterium]